MKKSKKETAKVIQKILDDAIIQGEELGSQIVIYQHGKKIIDICAGYTGIDKKMKVNPDTLFPIFSTGKSIAATVVHRLVEKGQLSYSMKIAEVWPEFACNGKENMTLEHILRHQSGVCAYPEWNSYADIANWRNNCEQIAAARPAWTPGDKTQYQSLNFSWLLCEPVQRVTGRNFSDIIHDEIYTQVGIDSMFFGISEKDFARCSIPERGSDMPVVKADDITVVSPLSPCVTQKEVREVCLPAFNCISNARSIAKYYAALIGNRYGVNPLLSTATLQNALIRKPAKKEKTSPFGLGYFLWGPEDNPGMIFGHHGHGGCEGIAFPKQGLAIGYTKNLLHLKQNTLAKIYTALDIPKK